MAITSDKQIFNQVQHKFKVENLREVRLIRDQITGQSRQLALAHFDNLESAKAFIDRYYPSIHLDGVHDHSQTGDKGAMVRIVYSREKEERDRASKNENKWICDICDCNNYPRRTSCFRCKNPRSGIAKIVTRPKISSFSGFATTGNSDASPTNTGSQFLMVRGLEPNVTEELLAKGMTKLYRAPPNFASGDLQTNKKTKISTFPSELTIGAKDGSLQRVFLVRDRKTNESWQYGFAEFSSTENAQAAMAKYYATEAFTIASKPAMMSYIHAGVFVPVLQQALTTKSNKFTFSPLSNPSAKLKYWDEAGYVSELITTKEDSSALVEVKESLVSPGAAATEGRTTSTKETEAKSKKRKAEKDSSAGSKKIIAPHLKFWSDRHAELHGLRTKEEEEPKDDNGPKDATATANQPKPDQEASDSLPSTSYADMERKCCLLCSRQFKTEGEVHRHEDISQLHRDNLLNEDLKQKALVKLAKSNAKQAEPETSAYRDRAKERRQAFSQPKTSGAQHVGAKETVASIQPVEDDTNPVPSKGAALLEKMGWKAGEGLGAQGTGRKEAIVTEAYTQGMGLGAQGAKIGDAIEEADRSTRGLYADYVNKSKDKAKERFQDMT